YEGSDDVAGVAVEVLTCAVVARRRARVSVASGGLHVAQRYTGVEGGRDEAVAQRVRRNVLGDAGPLGETPDDPGGAVAVETLPRARQEHRPRAALARGLVDGPTHARRQRDDRHLGTLAEHGHGAVA